MFRRVQEWKIGLYFQNIIIIFNIVYDGGGGGVLYYNQPFLFVYIFQQAFHFGSRAGWIHAPTMKTIITLHLFLTEVHSLDSGCRKWHTLWTLLSTIK